MSFSIESAIMVPLAILMITAVTLKSFDAYNDVNLNAKREAVQRAERIRNDDVYKICFREDGFIADVHTNSLTLLRFCIYLEDQGILLREVFGHDSD